MLLGSVTTDLSIDPIERFDLLEGARVLCSRWDWSEKLYAAGFVHALFDPARLGEAWEKAAASDTGPSQWYEDSESLLYCVYHAAPKPGLLSLDLAPALDVNASPKRSSQSAERRYPSGRSKGERRIEASSCRTW